MGEYQRRRATYRVNKERRLLSTSTNILNILTPLLCIKNIVLLYSIVRHRFFPSFNPVKRSLTNKTLQFIPLLCQKVCAMSHYPTTHDVEAKDELAYYPPTDAEVKNGNCVIQGDLGALIPCILCKSGSGYFYGYRGSMQSIEYKRGRK